MEWTDIIKIVLGTGVLSAVLNSIISHYLTSRKEEERERERIKREATFLAIRLATILEEFAHDCQNLMNNNQNYFTSGGAIGSMYVNLPKLSDYPGDPDWKCLAIDLIESTLSFKNEAKEAQFYIDFEIDVNDNEGGANEFILVSRRLGLRSLEISNSLRERYALPKYKYFSELSEAFKSNIVMKAHDLPQ